MRRFERAVEIADLRRIAKRRLPSSLFNQIDRGSEDDVSYRHNRETLERIKLIHRALVDVSGRDPSVELFGVKRDLPLIISPTGITSWVSYRGEVALARAAARAGIPFTLTSTTSTPIEEVKRLGGGHQWYQAIMWRDLDASLHSVMRAREADFEALFLTVDSTISYNRPWDRRAQTKFPFEKLRAGHILAGLKHPQWALGTPGRYLRESGRLPEMVNIASPDFADDSERKSWFRKDEGLDWAYFDRVRALWPRKLIVKGILHPDDARLAVDHGADAVVVSNHGGSTNDSAPSPMEVLPGVVGAVGSEVPVLIDSGFRRGSDIVKAIALGASAVMIGRAALYGLAAGGEAGADHALGLLREEIVRTMGAMGVARMSELGRDHVVLPGDLDVFARHDLPWQGSVMDRVDAHESETTARDGRAE